MVRVRTVGDPHGVYDLDDGTVEPATREGTRPAGPAASRAKAAVTGLLSVALVTVAFVVAGVGLVRVPQRAGPVEPTPLQDAGAAPSLGSAGGAVEDPPAAQPVPPVATAAGTLTAHADHDRAWAAIAAHAGGTTVLRPTWLPLVSPEVSYDIVTAEGGLVRYVVSYGPLGAPRADARVRRLVLTGDLRPGAPAVSAAAGRTEEVRVRGRDGVLIGSTASLQLLWDESGARLAVHSAQLARDDVLLLASSLAPVADRSGRVAAHAEGVVAEVRHAERTIVLAAGARGPRRIALHDRASVELQSGRAGALHDLAPGMRVEAFGAPAEADTLHTWAVRAVAP